MRDRHHFSAPPPRLLGADLEPNPRPARFLIYLVKAPVKQKANMRTRRIASEMGATRGVVGRTARAVGGERSQPAKLRTGAHLAMVEPSGIGDDNVIDGRAAPRPRRRPDTHPRRPRPGDGPERHDACRPSRAAAAIRVGRGGSIDSAQMPQRQGDGPDGERREAGRPRSRMASGAIMARPHPANNAGTIQGDAGSGATRYVEQTRVAAGAGSPTKRSSSASTL